MASINYDEILSRFYTKVEAFDFIYENISDEMMDGFVSEWVHSSIVYPPIRKLFNTVTIDDENKSIEYELQYEIDEWADKDFVVEVLACGFARAWLKPKVASLTNISQFFGSSEQRMFSQSAHLEQLRQLLSDMEYEIRAIIRDRGYFNNTYLDGGDKK